MMVMAEPLCATMPTPVPAPMLESFRVSHVRGPVTQQIRQAVLLAGGQPAWEALLEKVSEECRSLFMGPIGSYEWVDADLAAEMNLAFLEFKGPDWILSRGRSAAREQLLMVHRWLIKLASPEFLLNNAPRMLGLYYRGCKGTVEHIGSGEAVLKLWAQGYYREWYSHGLVGWLQGALELSGAKDLRIHHQPPAGRGLDSVCHRYRVTWKP